jgi:hypothetical protein
VKGRKVEDDGVLVMRIVVSVSFGILGWTVRGRHNNPIQGLEL